MIYPLISNLADAIQALKNGDRGNEAAYDELRADVCRSSRLLAYEVCSALLSYRGLVTEEMLATVLERFDQAITALGDSKYTTNVRARKAEIEEAAAVARQRRADDEEFLQSVAERFPVKMQAAF